MPQSIRSSWRSSTITKFCLRNITTKKITFDWHLAIHPLIVITRLASWRSWPLKIHKTDVWICSGLQPLQRSSLEFFFTKTRPDWTRKMTDEIKTINTGDLKKTKRAKIQTQPTASFFRQCPENTESHKKGQTKRQNLAKEKMSIWHRLFKFMQKDVCIFCVSQFLQTPFT